MHVKSFVLASFAACIVTAIPIPDDTSLFCPAEWKRSPQTGCRPQTLTLPTLEDLPLSQKQYNGLVTYPTDATINNPSLITPANPAESVPQPAPKPLNEAAPWLVVPGAVGAGWAIDQILKPKGANGEAPNIGNWWEEAGGSSRRGKVGMVLFLRGWRRRLGFGAEVDILRRTRLRRPMAFLD